MNDEDPMTKTLELVRRSQDGDKTSLERLLARYYPRVRKIVRVRMGNRLRQRMESQDVLQEVFAHAVSRFEHFDMRNEKAFLNWLTKIAERELCNEAQKVNAQKRDPAREVTMADRQQASPALDPLDHAIQSEEAALVESCIDCLPAEDRELIALRSYVGLSFEEIALETHRPSANAARQAYLDTQVRLAKLVKSATRG